tara:strand:- start:224 stop:442 length:219 start_codon:yes stop_codon:yes gene_type:complete
MVISNKVANRILRLVGSKMNRNNTMNIDPFVVSKENIDNHELDTKVMKPNNIETKDKNNNKFIFKISVPRYL